tara:strand:- start:2223 stop:2627 length:405 start_codon:yes stop_codon:yes gene_type:complete
MGFFLGYKTYDLKRWCIHCEEEYDEEDEHEHEECEDVTDYLWEIIDDYRPIMTGLHHRNYSCEGVMGPGDRLWDVDEDYPWLNFRLMANDKLVLFHGKIAGRYKGPEPLDDFGREHGCCIIEYEVKGGWERLTT